MTPSPETAHGPGPVPPLWRRALAELLGSALLAAVVIGSGIAAQRLSPGDTGLQLLENAAATAVGLVALILTFGPVSGAHLNPVVSLVDRLLGGIDTPTLGTYVVAQVAGCCGGAALAHAMFELPLVQASTTERAGSGLWVAEVVATVGLLLVIFAVVRSGRAAVAPFAVGAYIGGAYFWTASTSFANPAITIGRTLTDTFAGIAPSSAPGFIAAQLGGAAIGLVLIRALYPDVAEVADAVVVPPAPVRPSPLEADRA